ncbi:MAG: shikimate dehydrogenase [Spirochaetaceae bacterium]|nr:MAG: shikimate dehydrogenase [Spirochaetaceae bacterium]
MEQNFRYELVGAFGDPIDENPTGVMFEAAFEALGLKWRYLPIRVTADGLRDAVAGLRAFHFKGINCTIPHKVKVMDYLDSVADDAAIIGAVNTVRVSGGKLIGENTDGKGFLKSLKEDANVDPSGKHVVVLGAGGAARAITVELALAGAASILVVNRTTERGKQLVARLKEKTPTSAEFQPWTGTFAIPAGTDIVVNSTSIGLYPNVNDKADIDYDTITASMTVCDVIPNPPKTPFLAESAKRGATTLDGMGMLVNQGVVAFKHWTGQDPPADAMHAALAKVFG